LTLPAVFVAVMVNGQVVVAFRPEMVALVAVRFVIVGVLPATANVNVTAAELIPPDQVTLNEDAVQAENVIPVMALGIALMVTPALDVIPPVPSNAVLFSVITNTHEVPVKPEKVVGFVPLVENPVDEPLIVYEYITLDPTPPVHETTNPVGVTEEGVTVEMEDGGDSMIKLLLVTLPPVLLYTVLVSVMTRDHDVPDIPVNVVGLYPLVENPVDEPLMVYEYTMLEPTPPDQEATNPVRVMEDAVTPVIAVGGANTVSDADELEYPLVAVMVRGHEVSGVKPAKVAVPVPEELGNT